MKKILIVLFVLTALVFVGCGGTSNKGLEITNLRNESSNNIFSLKGTITNNSKRTYKGITITSIFEPKDKAQVLDTLQDRTENIIKPGQKWNFFIIGGSLKEIKDYKLELSGEF